MTKKKPGAVRGRPKGSGKGLEEKLFFNATTALRERIDAAAGAAGMERSSFLRSLIEAWDEGRPLPPRAPETNEKKPAKG